MRHLVAFFVSTILLSQAALALDPAQDLSRFHLRVWTTADGLPQNGVTALAGSRNGYLWVGTQEGLARFDGLSFTVFDHPHISAFKDSFISALLEDRQGVLWIGTREGLVRHEGGRFDRLSQQEGLPDDYVRTLLEDQQGNLWIGTYGGAVVRLQQGGVKAFGQEDGRPLGAVRALFEDRDETLWAGTAHGLFRFREGRFEPLRSAGLPEALSVRALAEDGDGNLWVAAEGGGVYRRRQGAFEAWQEDRSGTSDAVRALYQDNAKSLWLGTQGEGLLRLVDGQQTRINQGDGLAHDVIWSLYEDATGSVWVGTRGGLTQIKSVPVTTLSMADGLSDPYVRTVMEDSQDRLWVGTNDGGLALLQGRDSGSFTLSNHPPKVSVRALHEGPSGALWVGSRSGLDRLQGAEIRSIPLAPDLPSSVVNAILERQSGDVWVGTSGGLARLEEGLLQPLEAFEGREVSIVRFLLEDQEGALWAATEKGLLRQKEGAWKSFGVEQGLPSDFVYALHEDNAGTLWIGTAGGLARYRDGEITAFTKADGLYSNVIFRILEDDHGNLWLSCNKGIFRIEKSQLEAFSRGERKFPYSLAFDEADGMESSECNGGTQPAGWKSRDGRLWFPTIKGLAMIDPERLKLTSVAPPVILEKLVVDGNEVPLESRVVLPPSRRNLEFYYAAPKALSPNKIRFRYQLEGSDPQWVEVGTRRVAYYTHLPAGHYRFRVAASNDQGEWSPEATEIEVTLAPFFFQTWWFYCCLGLLGVLLLAALYRSRTRSLASRQKELEALVSERTSQIEDANRKLQRLTEIDPLTGIANQRQLRRILDQEWRRATRSKAPLALLLIDVDFFKEFNDTYGHLAGDRCLVEVAEALSRSLHRAGDAVARYGGEEFAAILPRTDEANASLLGEKLRQAVEELDIEHRGSKVSDRLTVSIGVAVTNPSSREASRGELESLLAAADEALYRSKREGRNRVS
ncbi:MAG: diguanylate cyclase [Deltaproteobacteria bacterium]|nr:diguanylate cyclase [Deltaproteobacteria bacterium]